MSISLAFAVILDAVPITLTVDPEDVSPVPAVSKNPVRSVKSAKVDVPPGIVWVFRVPALTMLFVVRSNSVAENVIWIVPFILQVNSSPVKALKFIPVVAIL